MFRIAKDVPIKVRENLELAKRPAMILDGEPKYGGKNVFIHRLWCRIQGIHIDETATVKVKIIESEDILEKMKEEMILCQQI